VSRFYKHNKGKESTAVLVSSTPEEKEGIRGGTHQRVITETEAVTELGNRDTSVNILEGGGRRGRKRRTGPIKASLTSNGCNEESERSGRKDAPKTRTMH